MAAALRIAIHHLHGHVAVERENEQPCAVGFVHRSVRVGLFKPDKPPGADKAALHFLLSVVRLTGGKSDDGCPEKNCDENRRN